MRRAIIAALALAGGCTWHCPPGSGWAVTGDVPSWFVEEANLAARALAGTELCAAGTVETWPAPKACYESPTGLCSGLCDNPDKIEVLFAPTLGYGTAIGTTALEHELCHASGIDDEAGADACAAVVIAKVKTMTAP